MLNVFYDMYPVANTLSGIIVLLQVGFFYLLVFLMVSDFKKKKRHAKIF